jgi:hypothetical protein
MTGMDRFAMASALVARARSHKDWIGDDHGDRYVAAMLSESVPDEGQIVVKEILDHLRAALDYCAQQVWTQLSGQPLSAKVYFPIAREGAVEADFLSVMNRHMPGVAGVSAPAYETFKSFQAFAGKGNEWLPELATLVNQTKHDHLAVASMPQTLMNYSRNENGVMLSSFEPGHAPKRGTPWMMVKASPADFERGGAFQVVFLQLKDILWS